MPIRKFIISILCVFIPSRQMRARFRTFLLYCDANRVRRCFVRRAAYDCICSFGNACFCANALDLAGLRKFSCPFDWIAGSDLPARTDLVLNDFPDFMNPADFEYTGAAANYRNTRTGFLFVHDFKRGGDFAAEFPNVREKYQRRTARLIQRLGVAQRTLILYSDHAIDPAAVHMAAARLQERFGGHIDFLCVDFAPNARHPRIRRTSDHMLRITVREFSDWAAPQRRRATRQLVTALAQFRVK